MEFRNKLWMESERDQHRTLGFLRDQGLALMNNCYSDHAVVGARQLSALLHGEGPEAALQVSLPGA